ncbi:MAG TPA: sensor histidine kinase [Deinococcales bacterium]|nr:sensor histidine kinase [Deinococcales bacterium]
MTGAASLGEARPGPRHYLAAAALAGLAAAGNWLRLPLFFGVDFLFGGIAVFVALQVLGARAALLAGLASAAVTYIIWNHPYAGIVFFLEAAVVAWLWRRGWSLVLANAAFWVVAGAPLIWLFYDGPLGFTTQGTLLVMLKDVVNGVFNALVAGLIVQFTPLERLTRRRAPPFREIVFNLLAAFVLFPSLLLLAVTAARDLQQVEDRIRERLEAEGLHISNAVADWLQRRREAVEVTAEQVIAAGLGDPAALAAIVSRTRAVDRDLQSLQILDGDGRIVVADPGLDRDGRSLVGQDRSGRPYFRAARETLRPGVSDSYVGALGNQVVAVTWPIVRGGRLAGVVVGGARLERLRTLLANDLEPGAYGTVLDSAGNIVAATASRPPVAETGRRLVPRGGSLTQLLPPGNPPPVVRWRDSYYRIVTPIPGQAGWRVQAQAPVAPYQGQVQQGQIRAFLMLIGLSAFAFALAALVSRRVTEPLVRLAAATRDLPTRVISGGSTQWPAARGAELETLIANFREVTASLAASFGDLRSTTGSLEARTRELAAVNAVVTELNNRLEERVRERTRELEERNAEQETFIYTVSHDLRTPLLSIAAMAELLGEAVESGDGEQAGFLLGRVQRNVAKMGDLLNDLLALSRAGRQVEPPAEIDLGEVVRESLAELQPVRSQRAARVHLPEAWPRVTYPPSQAGQVVGNLLSNALKWAGRDDGEPAVAIAWLARGEAIELIVEDNGPGVPPAYRERVFELFQKLDPEAPGTGVGLAIVKRIVERQGGSVWVDESRLGGAAFRVTLPAAPASHGSTGSAD